MPVIQMAFDVSGIRSGVDKARAQISALSEQVRRLEERFNQAGWAATSSGQAQSKAFKGLASQVHRLAAEVAGLYSAFKAFDTLKGIATRGIEVNETLESAKLATASIISATNNIADAQGRVLQGAEKFAAAEQISAKMMKEMQLLALQTTASFKDIADGVAGIIAPATKAGIAMEKIPKFAVTAVQAMTTMGLQTNQMRTEIEAILSGNINKSQDLLATNLGITKEMVQEWQKAGTLQENLMKRMESFNIAGVKAQQTWRGLKGNMEDALDFLSSYASADLFEHLKNAWSDVIDFMIDTNPETGEIGLSKNIDGLMQALKELEDEIGEALNNAIHDLMDWVADLNRPERIAEIKQSFVDFTDKVSNTIDRVSALIEGLARLGRQAQAVWGWIMKIRSVMPGAIVFDTALDAMTGEGIFAPEGKKEQKYDVNTSARNTGAEFRAGARRGAFGRNFSVNGGGAAAGVGYSLPGSGAGTKKKPFGTSSAIGKYDGGGGSKKKSGGGGKSDAQKLAENAERYSLSLEKMRNEVEALENAMNPALTTYDRTVAKINAEKEAAIKNADVKARETVQRKQATQAQAEEMAGLEKRKAELTANQKLDELQLKTLRDKSNFYKEFAELTGRTGESIEYQNQLIDKQAQEWIALGIPMDDVNERVRLMKMEISDNPWDAMVLGLKSYASETGSLAKTMADQVKGAFDSIGDSFTDLIMTGKMQFTDFANSIIRDLMRIMVQKAIVGPLANGLGGLLGGVGQGFSNIMSGGTWDFGVASGGFKPTVNNTGMTFAFGGAFSGLHGYANQIVARPTLFSYGSQLTRFAKGGVMGEAGPEAVMPLTRMGDGHLGVRAYGGDEPVVNVTIVNNTGQKASQQTKTDNQGNKSIEVMVGDMAAGQMVKTGTALNKAARSFSGISQPVTRR